MAKSAKVPGDYLQKVAKIAMWSFVCMVILVIITLSILFNVLFAKYENEKEGWSLYYPRGWTVASELPQNTVIAFVAEKENPLDFFQDNIAITYTSLRSPMTLSEYIETAKMQMTKTLGDVTVAESKLVNISGHPGARLFFQSTSETKLTFVVYVFLLRDMAYNVTYAAMTEHYEKKGKYFMELIMTTLKVKF